MKLIAVIVADFDRSPIGTRSRLADDLYGESLLRRTLRRITSSERLASVHLAVSTRHAGPAAEAAAGLDVNLETHAAAPVPWQKLVASARKWSLDGWRGGLVSATVLDEFTDPWVSQALGKRESADAVVAVPAAAPLIDPQLIDDMIARYEEIHEDARLVFTQSAPGLSGAIYATSLLDDLINAAQPVCRVMAYVPTQPQRDMIMQPCFHPVPAEIAHAMGRCIVDTQTAFDRVSEIVRNADGEEDGLSASAVSRSLTDRCFTPSGPLPLEVELELITEDSLPETALRPRGKVLGRRAAMEPAVFERLVHELSARDDTRIVLGGFGDPLLHPRLPDLLHMCRNAGIFALAVRTPLVRLDDDALAALFKSRVDVLNVVLDAHSAETYRAVHKSDAFDQVNANIERVLKTHAQANQPQPLVVCEMAKMHATMDEIEPFYDHWISRTGSAVIAGPSHYAGQYPDRSVMNMAPPHRTPCRRIFGRAMILADGRVTMCDQDFKGTRAIGSITSATLSDLWLGDVMTNLRDAHTAGRYDELSLCSRCDEWHRP